MSGGGEGAALVVPDGWTVADLVDPAEGAKPFCSRPLPNAPRVGEEVWVGGASDGPGGRPLEWTVYRVSRVSYLSPDPRYAYGPLRCWVRVEVAPLTTLSAEDYPDGTSA